MEKRKFIFRAWNGEIMLNNIIPMMAINDPKEIWAITDVQGFPLCNANCIYYPVECIMQSLDRFDINKKLIFEGDVVIYRGDKGAPHEYLHKPEVVEWVVEEWNEDGFGTGFQFMFPLCDYEVIGNIFENPEYASI